MSATPELLLGVYGDDENMSSDEPINVTGTGEPPPPERPSIPARRGGARAAAEAAKPAEVVETTATEPAKPAEQAPATIPANPSPSEPAAASTPAPTRRRPAPPAPAQAVTPPPAESNQLGTPETCPEIAPGVNIAGFHGKAWPQLVQFTVISAAATPYPAGSTGAIVKMTVKADRYEGPLFSMDGAAMKDGAPVITSALLKVGAEVQANWYVVPKAKAGVKDYGRPPSLVCQDLEEASTFG